jgi:hypothetical protein
MATAGMGTERAKPSFRDREELMKDEPVQIQLTMRGDDGVIAVAIIPVERWIALYLKDRKNVKKFKGREVLSFRVFHHNGGFSWPA